jgi:hypothetical protein
VQLSGQPAPSNFVLELDVTPTEAKANMWGFFWAVDLMTNSDSTLDTDWVDPFKISPKVKVLQPVSLGVIIVFAVSDKYRTLQLFC